MTVDADGWRRHVLAERETSYAFVRVRQNLGRAALRWPVEWRLTQRQRGTGITVELARGLAASYNEAIAVAGAIVRLMLGGSD